MKKDLFIALIAILAVAAVAFALDRVRPDLPLTPSQPYAAKGETAREPKSGKIVMHVNGEAVTEEECNAFGQNLPEEQRGMVNNPQGKRVLATESARHALPLRVVHHPP